ncbi:MAG: hypothetical protein MJE77_39845 [Proteobacteria bacterium]|nr:hypothetical protein [Pseudomonadota bacterium]
MEGISFLESGPQSSASVFWSSTLQQFVGGGELQSGLPKPCVHRSEYRCEASFFIQLVAGREGVRVIDQENKGLQSHESKRRFLSRSILFTQNAGLLLISQCLSNRPHEDGRTDVEADTFGAGAGIASSFPIKGELRLDARCERSLIDIDDSVSTTTLKNRTLSFFLSYRIYNCNLPW